MNLDEITRMLQIVNMDPCTVELVEFAYHQGAKHAPPPEPKCSDHPKAPHGFMREASHSADRYVCECEGWDAYEAGKEEGIQSMLHLGYGDNPNPLTASEIVDCATATYQCDANDVSENTIKFARHIERLTLERQ